MSNHIEWADASYATNNLAVLNATETVDFLRPEDEPADGQFTLAINTGSSVMAINGTPEQLFDFAKALLLATLPIQPGYPEEPTSE